MEYPQQPPVKIYTKTGDTGKTSLFGGKRVPKDTLRIEAYGTVDELNSILGVCRSMNTAKEVAKKYEGRIAVDERIIDACAMQLVMNPWQFDVIVTTNLFGDILSDEISGLVGGLGVLDLQSLTVRQANFRQRLRVVRQKEIAR